MTNAKFKTKAERDAHLKKYRDAEKVAMDLWDADAPEEEVDDADDRAKELKQDYIPRLPVLPMSICPICGETFIHRIDPFGFDGPWWESCNNDGISNCSHAKLIRSAYRGVDLMELKHDENSGFRLGPEVPYVIARILEMDSMVCVVSRTKISDNDDLFAMVYFSALEVEWLDLTMSWDNKNTGSWSHDNDPWDFDLKPWVEKGKLRYCVPGEEPLRLGDMDVASFPFLEEPGYPARRFVHGGQKRGPYPFVPGHKITSAPMSSRDRMARTMVMADASLPIISSWRKRVTHNGTNTWRCTKSLASTGRKSMANSMRRPEGGPLTLISVYRESKW